MLRAALFDFDGTLVDTTELIYQSMRHATGEILEREIPRETLMANVGQPLPRQMELIDAERAEALITSVAVSWGAFSEDTLREAELDHLVPDLDSAVDVLLEISER